MCDECSFCYRAGWQAELRLTPENQLTCCDCWDAPDWDELQTPDDAFEVHCSKTGRSWPCASEGQARQMARNLGVTDYTFCPPGTAPATIRETTAAMRALREEAPMTDRPIIFSAQMVRALLDGRRHAV
ncbi:hypothetical protein [Neotabrizicola sp. VNH66]|uniref:hypothetical protein n=1 Tax=Neotabrizicola sp. VNH66 TaxID=3400918 RepID=UPI003BFE611F